jgi:hypothetical protein
LSTARFTDAVTALLAAYAAAAPLAGIPVYDGASVSGASDPKFIIVGHDGTIAADGTLSPTAPAGNYVQAWADSTSGREENGWVNCVAVSQTGEAAGLADCRTGTDALLTAAEDAASGGGAAHLTFDGTSDGRFIYRQGPNGAAVICAYRVTYSAPWG